MLRPLQRGVEDVSKGVSEQGAMTMLNKVVRGRKGWPAAAVLACGMLFEGAFAQSPQGSGATAAPPAPTSASRNTSYLPSPPARAHQYYQMVWGVDDLTVKSAESGELIRFNYRVIDAARAQQLNDKKSEPFLYDEQARVKLVVPSMEKVGQLRQSATPEAGKVYWMAFSNKGGLVKRGDRVTVVIGNFRAEGLIVQ